MEVSNHWVPNQDKYYDIEVDPIGKTYSVIEANEKHERSAFSTLEKIANILNLNFKPLNLEDPAKILKISEQIRQGYQAKISSSVIFIFENFQLKKLNEIHIDIENRLYPTTSLPLDHDSFQKTLNLLSCKDVNAFCIANRDAKKNGDYNLIDRVKEARYYECLNVQDANSYLKELFTEIKDFYIRMLEESFRFCNRQNESDKKARLFAKKYVQFSDENSYEKGIDPEKTLKKMQNLSIVDLFTFFKDYYGSSFKKMKVFIYENEMRCPKNENTELNIAVQDSALGAISRSYNGYGYNFFTKFLLERAARINVDLGCKNYLLHHAVSKNDYEFANFLLLNNANVNFVNVFDDGQAPLHYAIKLGHEIINLLLDNGAYVDIQDEKGFTPLHNSVRYGQYDVVKLLLDRGAQINLTDQYYRSTPLHFAVKNRNYDIAKLLLERGAKTNIINRKGKTALEVAEGNSGFLFSNERNKFFHDFSILIKENDLTDSL